MTDFQQRMTEAREKLLPILQRYADENALSEIELASVLTTVIGGLAGEVLPRSGWRRFANEASDAILEWARITKRTLDALAQTSSTPH